MQKNDFNQVTWREVHKLVSIEWDKLVFEIFFNGSMVGILTNGNTLMFGESGSLNSYTYNVGTIFLNKQSTRLFEINLRKMNMIS